MKCLDDHHHYVLDGFENPENTQELKFIKKEPVEAGSSSPQVGRAGELRTIHDGTTNEEVLKMLIHRLGGLYNKFPSPETADAIRLCEIALSRLEDRTRDRVARGVEGKHLK